MFSVVFATSNQQLIIFNHTSTAVRFQHRDGGTVRECVVVYAAGGVSTATRGERNPRGGSSALSTDPQALSPPPVSHTRWADAAAGWAEQWTCSRRLHGAVLAPGRWVLALHRSLHPRKASATLQWHCTHRDAQILMHGCKSITHLPMGQSRQKALVWLGLLSSSLQACSVQLQGTSTSALPRSSPGA